MPMCNLTEYSDNYAKTSGSLWQYCLDITALHNNAIANFSDARLSDSFNFRVKITGQTGNDGTKDVEIMVPLKYLNNFLENFRNLFDYCEVNLILTWSSICVIVSTNNANQGATFTITNTRLNVPIVTLSTQENAKLLQQLKSGFKRAINWNKYLSKLDLLAENPNLNHLVEPSVQGVNRLFVLAFEGDTQRTCARRYYLPTVEIKDYNQSTNQKIIK